MSNIDKTIQVLKFQEIEVIGSASDVHLKYFSDIDSQTFLETPLSKSAILHSFQKKVKTIMDSPNMYFVELKAGINNNSVPLKWNYKEVQDGYKYIDGRRITFQSVLAQHSIIKIDTIVKVYNQFIEISANYYISFIPSGDTTFNKSTLDEVKDNLLWDYTNLKRVDFYKALKRLYSYYKLVARTPNDPDRKKALASIDVLRRIFNSKLGFLNKQLSNLKTINILLKTAYQTTPGVPALKLNDVVSALIELNDNLKKNGLPLLNDPSLYPKNDKEGLSRILTDEISTLALKLDHVTNNFLSYSSLKKDLTLL